MADAAAEGASVADSEVRHMRHGGPYHWEVAGNELMLRSHAMPYQRSDVEGAGAGLDPV